jgi:hypothetical protein
VGKIQKFLDKRLAVTFFVLFVTASLLYTPLVSAVHETYYEEWKIPFDENSVGFKYRVEMNFQNEVNDKWVFGKTYQITYTIFISEVNRSYFNSDFYVHFFNPELTEQLAGRTVEVIDSDCYLSREGQAETLMVMFTPNPTFAHLDENDSTKYEASLKFKVYKNNEAVPQDYVEWQWMTDKQIPITFESQENPKSYVQKLDLTPIIIVGAIIVSVVIVVVLYRKRKK